MLDRKGIGQHHYYQPGFGTYVSSSWLTSHGRSNRAKSAYLKSKDAAMGSTFAEHVRGGYRFLMRYYSPGDQIYMFGFSRGSYVVRFLAQMVDHLGLLEAGNEDLVLFAWKTFAKWQRWHNNKDADQVKKEQLYDYMKAFRETFCCPVSQIRFIGLFDTINSVPRYEQWVQRSRFPFTTRTSAQTIRHAVAIDERRTKFKHDLISDAKPTARSRRARLREELGRHNVPLPRKWRGGVRPHQQPERDHGLERIDSAQRQGEFLYLQMPTATDTSSREEEDSTSTQDIKEVWFPGSHADIGGGFKLEKNEKWLLSYVPLVWMIQEAQWADLRFDPDKLKLFDCYDDSIDGDCDGQPAQTQQNTPDDDEKAGTRNGSRIEYALWKASTRGQLHDCLQYREGLPWPTVLSWRIMEYFPFRRMTLREDGAWKPVRWPLPLGEVRDIPKDARIHVSAIRRMEEDPKYRPGNLIEGGGGRGKRRVPAERGIGEWEVCDHLGSPVREMYRQKPPRPVQQESHHHSLGQG